MFLNKFKADKNENEQPIYNSFDAQIRGGGARGHVPQIIDKKIECMAKQMNAHMLVLQLPLMTIKQLIT